MKIELIRTVKHAGRLYTKGDVITADEGLGTYFCSVGWAKDVTGAVATGDPEKESTLTVHSANHKSKAQEA